MPEQAILVVEDRAIVATKVRRDLLSAGFGVAGAAPTVKAALDMAQTLHLAGAVLDVDLRGHPVFPVAAQLRDRGVQFIFLSGYSQRALPPEWQDVPLLEKPFDAVTLARVLRDAIGGALAAPDDTRPHSTEAVQRAWDCLRHTRDLVTEQRAWIEQVGFDRV